MKATNSRMLEMQRQAEEADRKAKEIVAARNGQPAPAAPVAPAQGVTPPAAAIDPAATPAPQQDPPQPASDQPAATPPPQPDPDPAAPQDDPNSDTWKHRFESGEGIRKAQGKQISDLLKSARALELQVATLQGQIAAGTNSPKPSDTAAPAAPARRVPESIRTDFEDLGKSIGELDDAVLTIEERAKRAESAATASNEAIQRIYRERCLDRLTQLVPDWNAVNESEEFKEWCLQTDPLFGVARQAGIERALSENDPVRLSRFFEQFKATQQASTPAAAPRVVRPRPDVSPASSRAGSSAAPSTDKVWKQSEVAAFYSNAARKQTWKTQPAEFERIDREIKAAQLAGKVVAG